MKRSFLNRYSLPLLLLIGGFYTSLPSSFAQFSLTGEFRTRTEYRYGYTTLPDSSSHPAFFTVQRTRLNAAYKNNKTENYLSLQDVRVWGDEEHLKDIAAISLHEAWTQLLFSETYSLKLGRQEIGYDDQRLLGSVDWAPQGRSHDAAILKIKTGRANIHLGGAYNQQGSNLFGTDYSLNNYKTLGFIWLSTKVSEEMHYSIIGISDGYEALDSTKKTIHRFTVGPNIRFSRKKLEVKSSFYWQAGQDRSKKDISAFVFAGSVAYKTGPVSLLAGIDVVSGTDATDTLNKKNRTFNTLYATNHKFYGHMDYFTDLPKHTRNGGLKDLFLQIGYKFSGNLSGGLDYHYFSLATTVKNAESPSQTLNSYLGSEFDSYMTYAFAKDVSIKLGYSTLLATTSLETLKGVKNSQLPGWGWLMITVTPDFFALSK